MSIKSPPHLARVATLPCEMLTSENYQQPETGIVINDKSQGSVATQLRYVGIFKLLNYYKLQLNIRSLEKLVNRSTYVIKFKARRLIVS